MAFPPSRLFPKKWCKALEIFPDMRNPFLQPVCAPTARRLSVVGHFDPARRQNQHPKIPVAERRIGKTAPGRLKSTRDCSGFLLLPAQPLRQTGCRKGQIFSLHAPGIPGEEKNRQILSLFPPVRLRYRNYAWGHWRSASCPLAPDVRMRISPGCQPGESSLCFPILSPAFSEQFLNDGARDVR